MTHHCHAIGCETKCKPEFLMCPRHWRMVPKRSQILVYRHYRPGQCDDFGVTGEWHAAADIAIAHVAKKEDRISAETLVKAINKASSVLPELKPLPHNDMF